MFRKCFSLMLALVFCCTAGGAGVAAKQKSVVKFSEAEKIRRKVLQRGTGVEARARVKLADGTKLKGYISEAEAGHFTLVRTDAGTGASVRINYDDVAEFKALGKGMSTTSKVLIGTGVAVGVGVVALALAFRNLGRSFRR